MPTHSAIDTLDGRIAVSNAAERTPATLILDEFQRQIQTQYGLSRYLLCVYVCGSGHILP